MAEENSFVYGIIHIGSSSLSMRIVEYKDADTIRVIEEVRKQLLGKKYLLIRNCLLLLYDDFVIC